ncbi:hypothetical protein CVT26_006705 [Gymnopilus dilepis]|uniref:Uncharacterized protein n=1 Tax=Gymnopilus dilepis TaxID=231916 RepID=A0A409W0N8_9AGAR|nr:hypothetical protein CVT26_006705 [Gymnopilus dilepis]
MMRDLVRRRRSNSSSGPGPDETIPPKATSPRMSILPSMRLPLLRRQDPNEPPSNNKPALLTLQFSSRSFLDSSVADPVTKEVLYEFKTVGTSTTMHRKDAKDSTLKTAFIKWPRYRPTKTGKDYTDGVLIQMKNARWYGGETLLSLGANPNSHRKFSIPNYSHQMRWKRYGTTYWCTTISVKGPVATLETPKGPEPMRLTVYETLHDKYDSKDLPGFQGVSVLLLDYLLLTAMLLVTDLQEWMLVPKLDGQNASVTDLGSQGPSADEVPFRSDPRFRKFLYGEPIFPKLSGEGVRRGSAPDVGTSSGYPDSPSSSPLHSPRTTLPSMTDSDIEDDNFDTFSLPEMRHAETRSLYTAESFSHSSHAPSHGFIDPSFYSSEYSLSRPPVPPLPVQYSRSLNGRNFSSQPSTPISATFARAPSRLASQPLISRSQTSSPFELGDHQHEDGRDYFDPTKDHDMLPPPSIVRTDSVRSSTSTMSRSGRRPLPQPPPVPPVVSSNVPVARRVQSSSQIGTYPPFAPSYPAKDTSTPPIPPMPRPQRSLPPTPVIMSTPPTANPHAQPSVYSTPSSSTLHLQSSSHTHTLTSSPSTSTPATSPTPSPLSVSITTSTSSPPQPIHMTLQNMTIGDDDDENNTITIPASNPHLPHPDTFSPGAASVRSTRQPPIVKAVQDEDLARYVHSLTGSGSDTDASPPSTSIYDLPPPAYNSINFTRALSVRRGLVSERSISTGVEGVSFASLGIDLGLESVQEDQVPVEVGGGAEGV